MLYTKPQGHWPFASGEGFWSVFTIYGRGGHLGHVTQTPQTNFRSPNPLRLLMKFGFDRPSGFGDLWKWWTTDRRRRTDDGPWLYYKLTNEPKGSGELKIRGNFFSIVACPIYTWYQIFWTYTICFTSNEWLNWAPPFTNWREFLIWPSNNTVWNCVKLTFSFF